jgi:hypothetical protein
VFVAVGDMAIGLATVELIPTGVIDTPVIERAQALRSNETDRRPGTNLWHMFLSFPGNFPRDGFNHSITPQ